MSYDGGLSIKVVNSELLRILKDHKKQGTFNGSEAICDMIGRRRKGMTAAVLYEYWDCAYVEECPRRLDKVLDCVMELFEQYELDIQDRAAYKLFKQEIDANATKINESYTYVEWIYAHDDVEETFRFENGLETYEEGGC